MAWCFGDSFDLYVAVSDTVLGYWDAGSGGFAGTSLVAGRFTGSQAFQSFSNNPNVITKSSGSNDAVHHIAVAFRQTSTLTGTSSGICLQLLDGTTVQCSIIFRSDGAILLQSGAPGGTTLATYTGAVTAANTWFAFEFEVVINNTTGSFSVRKNGNTSNDFSATSLNTRPGTNSYANKLAVGSASGTPTGHIDDLLWRSDASSVAWIGDIRCYIRLPTSDATSAQFSRSPTVLNQPARSSGINIGLSATTAIYTPVTATLDGTVNSVTISFGVGVNGNYKCSVFSGTTAGPTTVIASSTILTNTIAGSNTWTFPTPWTCVKGTLYWIGWSCDATVGTTISATNDGSGRSSTTTYAAFPVASPTVSALAAVCVSLNVTLNQNYQLVNEALQDGTTTYVYDNTVGHADFYNLAALGSTPASVVAVTTRGFMEKSDAGTRTGAIQLKSGSTTVAAPTVSLSTNFGWSWRTDTVDPNTSAAWTPVNVNSVQIGPLVVS